MEETILCMKMNLKSGYSSILIKNIYYKIKEQSGLKSGLKYFDAPQNATISVEKQV